MVVAVHMRNYHMPHGQQLSHRFRFQVIAFLCVMFAGGSEERMITPSVEQLAQTTQQEISRNNSDKGMVSNVLLLSWGTLHKKFTVSICGPKGQPSPGAWK